MILYCLKCILRGDRIFVIGTNVKKVASRTLGGIFCRGRTTKMGISAEVSSASMDAD
jgi:hypothetical protein